MGRWVNRDPIGEKGGSHLYAAVGNNGIGQIDRLGLFGMGQPHGCSPEKVKQIKDAFKEIQKKLREVSQKDFAECLACYFRDLPDGWGTGGRDMLRQMKQSAGKAFATPKISCAGNKKKWAVVDYTVVPAGETPQPDDERYLLNGTIVWLRPVYGWLDVLGEVDSLAPSKIVLREAAFERDDLRCTILHELVHSVARTFNEKATALIEVKCLGDGWGCESYGVTD